MFTEFPSRTLFFPAAGPFLTFVSLLLLAGCSAAAAGGPHVFFSAPTDGATVSSPVRIEMSAEQFTIEPAGDGTVRDNAGHLHLMIDVPCVAAGSTIPKDDSHRHFGDGSTTAELELSPGRHTLCLQAADGAHTALEGLRQSITIEVE